jgi:hypothetical protein
MYPQPIIDALASRGLTVDQLPTIDLGDNTGHIGYIDFLSISDLPESTNFVRFTDKYGRCGLAFRVQNQAAEIDGVIAGGTTWVYGLA